MDRVGDIALFLQVLDQGSISAAARQLDLSVAVASQRLQRLERDLGVRLLHRTTRRLHPTPEGLALAQDGRALVEELAQLGARLKQRGGEVAGTLRVTASASFGRQYISPLLPRFLAAHPQLRVSLDLDDRMVDLVGAGYDLAIRIGQLDDSSLVSRRLAVNHRVLCASPDYLARRGEPRTPADLADHDCVLLTGRDGRQDLWRLTAPDGSPVDVRVRGRFESNYGEALRDAVLAGMGIAIHSTWHVHRDLQAGRLRALLPDWPVPASGIHAVMPGRTLVPLRVRAFVDFLAERFAAPPWAGT
ncbi:MAG: LysR family transcriptional regulator [Proteobacteria bacterium]|nr:LysR family transcriptional regulator [Pseudomonadota bacterium]